MEALRWRSSGSAERPGGVEKEQVKLPAIVGQPEVPDPVVWKEIHAPISADAPTCSAFH